MPACMCKHNMISAKCRTKYEVLWYVAMQRTLFPSTTTVCMYECNQWNIQWQMPVSWKVTKHRKIVWMVIMKEKKRKELHNTRGGGVQGETQKQNNKLAKLQTTLKWRQYTHIYAQLMHACMHMFTRNERKCNREAKTSHNLTLLDGIQIKVKNNNKHYRRTVKPNQTKVK